MYNILVPTDFSNDSYNALYYATRLYKNQNCTFHIMHAYNSNTQFKEEYYGLNKSDNIDDFLKRRTAECLLETYHRIVLDTEQNSLHKFNTVSTNKPLDKAIKSYVTKNKIELVVMGSKGATGALNIFIGGNTIKIVKSNIACPILCIPKQIDFIPISKVGYITSFKHSIEKKSLSILHSLITEHKATLNAIHICDDENMNAFQEENKELLIEYFQDCIPRFHVLPYDKTKAQTISNFAQDQELSLLAMCYYQHTFLDSIFREPVVLDLSIYTEIPLLILPTKA
ncbi:universal stress protein [Aurantibacter sp.]|uniref:universal stress protein n=1 Tax=Aurantibacter sp. TaxID=2807103 RepID=UPI0032671549